MEGFLEHIESAILINKERKEYYSGLSDGASKKVSNQLIRSEILIKPVAARFDKKGIRFNRQGIDIVAKDFYSMDAILPAETPPKYKAVSSKSVCKTLCSYLDAEIKSLEKISSAAGLFQNLEVFVKILRHVKALEKAEKVHFAMVKHLTESIGMMALNGLAYAEKSQGESLRLSRQLVRFHLLGLKRSVDLDHQAQEIHKLGLGIIVNDVPDIPLIEKFEGMSTN